MCWVARVPRRPDFCGCPPCPLCFVWADGPRANEDESAFEKMSQDLLGKPWILCTDKEREQLREIAKTVHERGITALSPAQEPPPAEDTADIDIGMSATQQINAWLKQRKKAEPPKPRQLTVDEIAAKGPIKVDKPKDEAQEQATVYPTPFVNVMNPWADAYNKAMQAQQEAISKEMLQYYSSTFFKP